VLGTYKPYLYINAFFAALVVLIILYSVIYSADSNHYSIPSFYKEFSTGSYPSEGLSRAFSEITRGHLSRALQYNPYSVSVYGFFVIQLFLRIFVSVLLFKTLLNSKLILICDVFISVLLFVVAFWPFFCFMIKSLIEV
jgi:hypothetical protein